MNLNSFALNADPAKGVSPAQLQIEFADVETLGEFWIHNRLPGIHWRLYYNDAPGAGVIPPGGRPIELLPEKLYLIAPCSELATFCTGNPEHLFIHFELDGYLGGLEETVHPIPADAVMLRLVEELRPGLKARPQDPMSQLYAIALTALALARLPPGTLRPAAVDPRIRRACADMRNDPGRQWSNAELAAKYDFATNSFTRRFREEIGVTPYRYLSTLRYGLAARLLESTNLTLGEICEKIGINDPFHFSREFKRYHERSPSLYRKVRTAMR